jgi:hypothetical protein
MLGCAGKTPPPVVNLCPVDKIPVIEKPPASSLGAYKKLKPGKQEITVSKPYGVYFPGKVFAEAEWADAVRSHYSDALVEQISKHNATIDKWITETKKTTTPKGK